MPSAFLGTIAASSNGETNMTTTTWPLGTVR
jgi:hypothetical protein